MVGLIARNELAVSISTNTEQIMTLNAQKSVQVLKDVNKKEFYLLESVASLPFIRDETISLEEKTAQLEGIVRENPEHFENLAFYSEQGICIRPDGEYVDVSAIDFFINTISGNRVVIDPLPKSFMMEGASDDTIMFYCIPVYSSRNPTKAIGILSAIVNGNDVYNLSESILIGKNSHPMIISSTSGMPVGRTTYSDMTEEQLAAIQAIKMQGAIDWSLVQKFAAIPNSKVVHLCYNKHELTWLHAGGESNEPDRKNPFYRQANSSCRKNYDKRSCPEIRGFRPTGETRY